MNKGISMNLSRIFHNCFVSNLNQMINYCTLPLECILFFSFLYLLINSSWSLHTRLSLNFVNREHNSHLLIILFYIPIMEAEGKVPLYNLWRHQGSVCSSNQFTPLSSQSELNKCCQALLYRGWRGTGICTPWACPAPGRGSAPKHLCALGKLGLEKIRDPANWGQRR